MYLFINSCIHSFYLLPFEVEFVPQKKAPAPSPASNSTKPKKTQQKNASGATDVEMMDMEWWDSVVARFIIGMTLERFEFTVLRRIDFYMLDNIDEV